MDLDLLVGFKLPQHVFRAYDIRGIVDDELTDASLYLIGQALGSLLLDSGEQQLLCARDGRLSSPQFASALQAGVQASGVDVIDLGELPTPLLYFATQTLGISSGAVVTGSHNPGNYNGVKMVLQGRSLAEAEIQDLYARITQRNLCQGKGKYTTADILEDYYRKITDTIKLKRPLKIVIDCGNGIAGKVAPDLYRRLGCEVIELFCEVDGRFPNHHPDPSIDENLQDLIQAVKTHQADMGLAFDGDADRLGVVTSQGEIIPADKQMMVFAKEILARVPGAKIVYDVKCSANLKKIIEEHHGQPIMCRTGHSLVKKELRETGAQLAGELSGHLFFKDRWYGFDDGLYAGVRMLEILASTDPNTLFASLPQSPNTPELKIPIAESEKFHTMQALINSAKFPGALVNTLDGLRLEYLDGWGLIRPSNTSPYLVARFEGNSIARIQTAIRTQLLAINPNLVIPF